MVAGKIGAVADRRLRMASKTAGAAEKMNGGGGKMEDMTVKTDEAVKKWKTISKEDGGCAEKTEDVCDKFAPMSQVVGTSVAQLFAQADDVQMVSK